MPTDVAMYSRTLEAPRETLRLNQGVLRHVYWDTYQDWKKEKDSERKMRLAELVGKLARVRQSSVELCLTLLKSPMETRMPSANVVDTEPVVVTAAEPQASAPASEQAEPQPAEPGPAAADPTYSPS